MLQLVFLITNYQITHLWLTESSSGVVAAAAWNKLPVQQLEMSRRRRRVRLARVALRRRASMTLAPRLRKERWTRCERSRSSMPSDLIRRVSWCVGLCLCLSGRVGFWSILEVLDCVWKEMSRLVKAKIEIDCF